MSTTVLGKVSMTPKGAWNASTSYEPLDVVSYGGSAFLARRANSNVTPTEGADWQMIAEKATVGNIAQTTGTDTDKVMSQKAVTDLTVIDSVNLYNPDAQTPETISPHYYVTGSPYTTTQFDDKWNCTAPIPVKENTQYSIGLVPAYSYIDKPWHQASHGVFCYDSDGNYIDNGSIVTGTFTTYANTAYIRFNYYIGGGCSLDVLNARCMLVEGGTLPTEYVVNCSIKQKLLLLQEKTEKTLETVPFYEITDIGTKLNITFPYGDENATMELYKDGGNNLFDFRKLTGSKSGVIVYSTGDWHAPFKISAVNNADGDNPTSEYFTGGNHRTTNIGSGGGATAKTESIHYFADGKKITEGSGFARRIEIQWANLVQGYNTSKEDGSGRYILRENHTIVFKDGVFHTHVELVPLENIEMHLWYGFQGFIGGKYPKTKYIGAYNRGEYDSSNNSNSGDLLAHTMVHYGDKHKLEMSIDPNYDLGARKTDYAQWNSGMFTSSQKAYFTIINKSIAFNTGDNYFLRGKYIFSPI